MPWIETLFFDRQLAFLSDDYVFNTFGEFVNNLGLSNLSLFALVIDRFITLYPFFFGVTRSFGWFDFGVSLLLITFLLTGDRHCNFIPIKY